MDKKIIIIFLILIVLGGSVFFIVKLLWPSSVSLNINKIEISPEELEKEYIDQVASITMSYFENRKNINLEDLGGEALKTESQKWLALVLKTKNDLLELRVPAKYKDLHLDLVLALSFLEQGIAGDEQKLKQGEDKLNKIIVDYPWIK